MIRCHRLLTSTATLLVSGALAIAPALAASPMTQGSSAGSNTTVRNKNVMRKNSAATNGMGETSSAVAPDTKLSKQRTSSQAKALVNEATAEVKKMENDPRLNKLIAKAKGIYLVPEFGRGALVVGGRGGAGVVLARVNGHWSNPAFYDFGAISFGAQAGASGGQIAFLLMTKNAVDQFKSGNKISLNAGAGLSIIAYSANSQASWGKGDIVMWSDTGGAYAGVTISVTDINWDNDTSKAYYGRKVDPSEVLAGKVNMPNAEQIKQVLPG